MKKENGFIPTAEINRLRKFRFESMLRAIAQVIKDPNLQMSADVHIWANKVTAGEIEIDDITPEMLNLASLSE